MRTIVITGANRGLGLEFAKQLSEQGIQVIATCRQPLQADALQQLAKEKTNLSIAKLDVTDDQSIAKLVELLKDTNIDWLINNAGTTGMRGVRIGNIARDNFLNVMNVNCLSALKVSEALLPNLQRGEEKLIITLSSRLGTISNNEWGMAYAYRASKAALNCVMRAFALDIAEAGIQVLLLNPGWVRTDLGGANGKIDVQTSVSGMLKVIAVHKQNSHAEILRSYDGNTIPW